MRARLAHAAWRLACRPEARRFRRALADVAGAQSRLLRQVVSANAGTDFGQAHGFGMIGSREDFRRRVPLADYDALRPFVDRIAAGERGVLTAEPVRLLEPTSGSTGGTKLIPYTRGLRGDFGRALAPWIADLYRRHPDAARGPHYWAISPAAPTERRTAGGVRIGFEDDAAYLGLLGGVARAALAVPPEVRHVRGTEAWRYVTLRALVARGDLALISVWSPTFLLLLLDALAPWADRLAHDLRRGTLSPPAPLTPALAQRLSARLAPDPPRAATVRAALAESEGAARHVRLWPRLAVVSAWADAAAARYAARLAALLPQAALQPKGLLATEGVVSVPLGGGEGGVLAVRSHVFEFLTDDGTPRWADEVERGGVYEVVLTTRGGLYRYRLRDLVEVVGFEGTAPRLRFLGRAGATSDRVGEKLAERHVRAVIEVAAAEAGVEPRFALVAFEGERRAYTLFVQADVDPVALGALGDAVEAGLRGNVHYAHARDLGQLGPLGVFRVEGDALGAYHARMQAEGRRLGDVKPAALDRMSGWAEAFSGKHLAPLATGG